MTQLRKDPVLERWVIIATERSKRPHADGTTTRPEQSEACPFCAGSERETPPEVLAYRPTLSAANTPGWTVRVVPNKYPALASAGVLSPTADLLYQAMDGIGAHEVVIESPKHCLRTAELGDGQVQDVLRAYQERLIALQGDPRWQSIIIYKNEGSAAGATLEHVHSQLLALPIVPREIRDEWRALIAYHEATKRCLYCEILAKEQAQRCRVVSESAAFVGFCPYASRFPLESWIMPKQHSAYFHTMKKDEIEQLAFMLRQSLQRLAAIADPSLNFVIHSGPLKEAQRERYHWHLEILPRISKIAGFELASGYYINTVAPETAAQQLREVILEPRQF